MFSSIIMHMSGLIVTVSLFPILATGIFNHLPYPPMPLQTNLLAISHLVFTQTEKRKRSPSALTNILHFQRPL